MKKPNQHIGSRFDDFLEEEGLLKEVEQAAVKRLLVYQLSELMKQRRLSKVRMAERMHTSRAALDRLLDPENESVTLGTLTKAASAVGKLLKVEFV